MNRLLLLPLVTFVLLVAAGCKGNTAREQKRAEARPVSDRQKAEFFAMIRTLPSKGEFFTPEGVKTAVPLAPVLLSLTEADLKRRDLYPFLALTRELLELPEQKAFFASHFAEIAHPELRLFIGLVLVNENASSTDVISYLTSALRSKKQAAILADMAGPSFGDFKARLLAEAKKRGIQAE